jgi:hypothetical protein
MLVMRASYSGWDRFARPFCDLASAIGSANPLRYLPDGASEAIHNLLFGQENASMHRQSCWFVDLTSADAMAAVQINPDCGKIAPRMRGLLIPRQKR